MSIIDLARTDVVTVEPTAGVDRIAETMAERAVGSVVVIEDDRPVGLVTDRDLALAVLDGDGDAADRTATDVMSADPFTVASSTGIYEALDRATEAGVRRVPVVDDDGALAGIVTLDDFIVLLASEFEQVSAIVQAESPPY